MRLGAPGRFSSLALPGGHARWHSYITTAIQMPAVARHCKELRAKAVIICAINAYRLLPDAPWSGLRKMELRNSTELSGYCTISKDFEAL